MFNPDDLLNYFKGLLTAPEPVGADPESVNLGNEPFCRGGKPLRFDVAAEPGEALPFTETLERRLWRVTLTASGTPGTGPPVPRRAVPGSDSVDHTHFGGTAADENGTFTFVSCERPDDSFRRLRGCRNRLASRKNA